MKKTYVKPEVLFEDFSSSTNLAGNCTTKTNTPSQGACAYLVTAGTKTWNVFLSNMTGICTTTEDSDGKVDEAYNGVCYHVPFGDSLFNS